MSSARNDLNEDLKAAAALFSLSEEPLVVGALASYPLVDVLDEENDDRRPPYLVYMDSIVRLKSPLLDHQTIAYVFQDKLCDALNDALHTEDKDRFFFASNRASTLLQSNIGPMSFTNKQPDGGVRLKPAWRGSRRSNCVAIEVATRNESLDLLFTEGAMWMNDSSDCQYVILVKLFARAADFRLGVFVCARQQATASVEELARRLADYKGAEHVKGPPRKPLNVESMEREEIEELFNLRITFKYFVTADNLDAGVELCLGMLELIENSSLTADMLRKETAVLVINKLELKIMYDCWRGCASECEDTAAYVLASNILTF